MERSEILSKMKELHQEYADLAKQLAVIDAPNKRAEFEKEQRRRLEVFKKELTVFAIPDAPSVDWAELESKLFDESNLENISVRDEGYKLAYDQEGQPSFVTSFNGTTRFTPFAYDKVDAERYLKRQKRKQRLAAEKNK